jgi:hypothetical protein
MYMRVAEAASSVESCPSNYHLLSGDLDTCSCRVWVSVWVWVSEQEPVINIKDVPDERFRME